MHNEVIDEESERTPCYFNVAMNEMSNSDCNKVDEVFLNLTGKGQWLQRL